MTGNSQGLVQTLSRFQNRIDELKREKADLEAEIERLRKIGEKQITAKEEETRVLEEEVAELKKELESLRELIDVIK
jgi:peptidoglycan hydrolase CwlO-like protein